MSEKVEKSSTTSSSFEEKGQNDHIEVTNVPFKRLVRKLNTRLLPLAGLIIFLQFVDKAALSVAAVLGIIQDTKMTMDQYISNRQILGTLLIIWGAITIATAFGKNFAQLAVLRVLLGVFEAGTYPALIMIFNTFNGLGSCVGSAAAVGIAKMGTRNGITAWQWGYVIWGSITVAIGIITVIFLIDSPESWFLQLTEEEKEIVKLRTQDNAVVRKQKVKVSQYWEALKEPRLWLLFITSLSHNLQNGGLVTYSTVLVHGLGFDAYESILLQIPSGAFTVIYIAIAVYINRRSKQIIYTALICYTVSALGCLLLAVLPNTGVKLVGYYFTWAQTGSYVMLISIIGSTVSGYSKKIFYNGANMLAYTIGNFAGPLMLVDSTKPSYTPTMWGLFGANLLNMVCLLLVRLILARINKKRAAERTDEPTDVYLNLTDKEDKNYVYNL
ncbi:major facilitator superfamily domain-containing protein [Mucor lusitanicus]